MRWFLTSLGLILTILDGYSQDQETKVFLQNFFVTTPKVVYTDAISPFQFEQVKGALNESLSQDTIYIKELRSYKGKPKVVLTGVLVLTKEEKQSIRQKINNLKDTRWGKNLLTNSVLIPRQTLDYILKDSNRSKAYFKDRYSPRVYSFSKPIFIRNNSLCFFYVESSWGQDSAGGEFMIFRKEKGFWKRWTTIYVWTT